MSQLIEVNDDQTVVSKAYLEQLKEQSRWLRALEIGGVDNWEFYGEVRSTYREQQEEEGNIYE